MYGCKSSIRRRVSTHSLFQKMNSVSLCPPLGAIFAIDGSALSGPQVASQSFPGAARIFGALLGGARNVDGFICSSVPELQQASMQWLEKSMGMPIIGVG